MPNLQSQKMTIGLFSLAMINIVAIASLRDLPQMAKYGLSSAFFYLLAALLFFFPVSLVAAELASAWPQRGGVYIWVREAFGERSAFVAIFIQWFQNLCWYPVVLTFAAASLAFAVNPPDTAIGLAQDKGYIVMVVLLVFWGATLLNFFGIKISAVISIVGAFCGVLIPGVLLISLAAIYLAQGNPNHLTFSVSAAIPDLSHLGNLTFAVSVLLAFAGMEMTAAHAREVRNPGRIYPLSITIAALVILTIFILGALAIAVVLPADGYDLQTGVTQAIGIMLDRYHLGAMAQVVAAFMAIGVIGSVNSWIIGPSKGLLAAGESGDTPAFFCKRNRHGVPVRILLLQALVVSVLCLAFTLQPTVSSAYFMLSVLTIQLYLIMYIIMFLAAIRLRYIRADVTRPFRIPGGNTGLWLVAGVGLIGAASAIILGFYPPSQFSEQQIHPSLFVGFLLTGILLVTAIPLGIYQLSTKRGKY
jgi:putative glutamate/gamma-aminobutyrate antiporter